MLIAHSRNTSRGPVRV